jgi:hypothetical protein
MKIYFLLLGVILPLIIFVACQSDDNVELPEGTHRVIVLEQTVGGNYSYFKVKEKDEEYWIAANYMEDVKKGDTLYYSGAMEMNNFFSKALEKEFDRILFVEDASKSLENRQPEFVHPELGSQKDNAIKLEPLQDGLTIEQIYADKENLNGKVVRIKGKITKFNDDIMGKNWLHIQDGTGSADDYDLLITTKAFAKVGDVIIIRGKVMINQDFGAGYKYDVMVEDAEIFPEI